MPNNKYKYLYFDLDRTLWDFEKNMHETMIFLFNTYLSDKTEADACTFISEFNKIHEMLWEKYRLGQIKKNGLREMRFFLTLKKLGITNKELSVFLNTEYLNICPAKTHLFPGTLEVLEYLNEKYALYILTNGFIETQERKLKNSGIDKFFIKIFSSELIGYNKPNKKIFTYAINYLNAKKAECIVIGDDLVTDIKGAKDYGLDQVFFNPFKQVVKIKPTFEISNLKELITIF